MSRYFSSFNSVINIIHNLDTQNVFPYNKEAVSLHCKPEGLYAAEKCRYGGIGRRTRLKIIKIASFLLRFFFKVHVLRDFSDTIQKLYKYIILCVAVRIDVKLLTVHPTKYTLSMNTCIYSVISSYFLHICFYITSSISERYIISLSPLR